MPSEYGDPESVYEEKLRSEHLFWLIETVLTAREQTLVRYYFGLGADSAGGMTLEDLAPPELQRPQRGAEGAGQGHPQAAGEFCQRGVGEMAGGKKIY